MTMHEEALKYIERQMLEQAAIIERARKALRDLEQERIYIMALRERDGVDPIQVRH